MNAASGSGVLAVDLPYLRERYPDPALRESMAREAADIAARARGRGNHEWAGRWDGLSRRFRDSLRGDAP